MAFQFATTYNPRINSKADTLVKIFSKRLGNIGLKGTYCPLRLQSIVIGTIISVAAPALVCFYVGDLYIEFQIIFKMAVLMRSGGNGILLSKLFLPIVRKNCSSDREKLLKFVAEGREFANFLQTIYSSSERSGQFLVTE